MINDESILRASIELASREANPERSRHWPWLIPFKVKHSVHPAGWDLSIDRGSACIAMRIDE